MPQTYRRSWTIAASHFNDQATYDALARAMSEPAALGRNRIVTDVLPNIHGHNFRITIEIHAPDHYNRRERPYLADDAALDAIVGRWRNQNLSVHEDFTDMRATTENMASVLHDILGQHLEPGCSATVFIGETDEITAGCGVLA